MRFSAFARSAWLFFLASSSSVCVFCCSFSTAVSAFEEMADVDFVPDAGMSPSSSSRESIRDVDVVLEVWLA